MTLGLMSLMQTSSRGTHIWHTQERGFAACMHTSHELYCRHTSKISFAIVVPFRFSREDEYYRHRHAGHAFLPLSPTWLPRPAFRTSLAGALKFLHAEFPRFCVPWASASCISAGGAAIHVERPRSVPRDLNTPAAHPLPRRCVLSPSIDVGIAIDRDDSATPNT